MNRIITTIVVYATIILTMVRVFVAGNLFVIAAILLERNLQSVANYLIVSLAVADLMVACLVMPLGAVYEVRKLSRCIKTVIYYRATCGRRSRIILVAW